MASDPMGPDITVLCPACSDQCSAPQVMAGRIICCPQCRAQMTLPGGTPQQPPPQPQASTSAVPPFGGGGGMPSATPLPLPPGLASTPVAALPGPRRTRTRKRRRPVESGGYFEDESNMMDAGLLGGIAIMAGAAVWFVVGWSVGVIYFYPPILFVVGLIAFAKGLDKSMGTGAQRPTRRRRRR